ncbi:MAG: folate family ECF transporter S component [Acidaminococcaceae bacterium]|jgi:ECF transporter S component (folate family)|nr:folate family ECF transporter S component [Acidaminococcaceae bacterium]
MKIKHNTRMLVHLSILLTIEIVLSRFFSISTPIVKISFAFVPLALCGILYGPVWAGVLGGLADLLGANLFPVGMYFPGFTLSGALSGVVYGLFLYKRHCPLGNIAVLVFLQRIVIGLGLSTYWLTFLTDVPFTVLFTTRILQAIILIPLQIVVLRAITEKISTSVLSIE